MVTFGFYDSIDHDRKYNAMQFGSIFDGIIEDGVYMHVGDRFRVNPSEGMTVTVGSGRAWFNHTWTLNDAPIPLTLEESEITLDRYDAIALDVNSGMDYRVNDIIVVKGIPGSEPLYPSLISTDDHHQYALAYILVKAGATAITIDDITNMVGSGAAPFVTGVLQNLSIDEIVGNWEMQWRYQLAEQQKEFEDWFNSLKVILDGDVATNLTYRVVELEDHAILDSNFGVEPAEEPPEFEWSSTKEADQNG